VRIVVVDPSRTVLRAVSQLLEHDGHVVHTFVGGAEALDFIKSDQAVDALMTSAELASMSGLELCWETRLLSGHNRAIYIILMSSNSEQNHLINALDSGADEFIRKPPSRDELYARLRSAERQLGLQRDLIRLATIDSLTGIFNRRALFDRAKQLCDSARVAGPLAAIMFDVDHFKRVNDNYGHDVGDRVLKAIGQEASQAGGVVGRLGGEEFAILLEGATIEAGAAHAERLRTKLGALSFETSKEKMSVSCSFGVADRLSGETIDQVLKRADAALYNAKNSGRNRVVTADHPDLASENKHSGLFAGRSSDVEGNHISVPNINIAEASLDDAFVLDDEPQVGALVCKVLKACGFTPRQFTSPAPFLADLKESPPGLVVLDLSLGQSDAVEVIHNLEERKYQGRVLLISGRDEETLNEITQIGDRHGLKMLPPLKKPFRPSEIKRRLANEVVTIGQPSLLAAKTDRGDSSKPVVTLVEALRNNWLELWYQPKIDLKTARVCGAEGLIRARHPSHGIVMPENLLPPAGDPTYEPLTKFVIERAIADWTLFAQRGLFLRLSVNAPFSAIHSAAFITHIRSALPKDPKFCGLSIEITEDEVIRDSERAREVASQLKLYNVDLSIDDFGSGYAALSRLKDLPFAEVKIDRSFVSGCASDHLKHSLCQTVVDLAHRFGATACAEGVETIEDLRAVMAMECDSAQAFLLAKPMPAADITETALVSGTSTVRALLRAATDENRPLARSA
jgi:two-component system, cell cycle response regulator